MLTDWQTDRVAPAIATETHVGTYKRVTLK